MRVFISGPLEGGNQRKNVRQALQAASEVMAAGHSPFVPHLDWFWDIVHAQAYEDYMRIDFDWLSVSDALIRLPGESPGGDREVAEARRLKIPVFFGVDSFLSWAEVEEPSNAK